jgi:hypothetical protein
MKRLITSLATILFLASLSFTQSKDSSQACQGLNKKDAALVSQYKELRERRRQLPEGTYDKDLSDDNGKLHRVLISLGEALGHPPFTKQIIVACLGEPDAINNGQQMSRFLDIYNRESRRAGRKVREPRNPEYLVYYWRGGHDFMFFINEGGLIVDHGWWFAYE